MWENKGDKVGQSGGKWGAVPMFMGEYQHTIDAKGRLIVPAKFREALGAGAVLTRGLDNCLFLFPPEEWRTLEEKLKSLPLTKAGARQFVRFLFSGATECELDKQGRIVVPQHLRDYAGIEKEAVVIGVSNRVEIWSKARWEAYMDEAEESYEAIAESIVDLGI